MSGLFFCFRLSTLFYNLMAVDMIGPGAVLKIGKGGARQDAVDEVIRRSQGEG